MSVALPTFPQPQDAQVKYLDFGSDVRGGQGGATIRFDRPGNRFALEVTMPPLPLEPRRGWGVGGRVFLSRLRRAKREGAVFPFPQPGFKLKAGGAPLVNGAAVANTASIGIRGLSGGSILREGQFVSIVHGGRRFLHSFVEERAAPANGILAAVLVDPPLRASLVDGDVIELIPLIEGPVLGEESAWGLAVSHQTSLQFTIEEAS